MRLSLLQSSLYGFNASPRHLDNFFVLKFGPAFDE